MFLLWLAKIIQAFLQFWKRVQRAALRDSAARLRSFSFLGITAKHIRNKIVKVLSLLYYTYSNSSCKKRMRLYLAHELF